MLPAAIVFSIIHETGPVVTGLVVSGRVGAGIGAELGSMKVTEQIDAIEASGVNPYKLLAFTRILACILMLPLLTLAADFCGVVAGWIADTLADPISFHKFLHAGLRRHQLQRFSGADVPNRGVRPDHRDDCVLSGNAQPGRHRGRGAFGDEFRGVVFAVRDSGGRHLGEIDSGVLPMMHADQTVTLRVTDSGDDHAIETAEQNNAGPAVVLQGLHKSFGAQKVLNGIDLTVGSGETLAVLGRSGTGKSVLLKLIIGLQKPDSGSIRIHGQEITSANLEAMNEIRKKMGFLFQHAALYDSLTVEENVAFPLRRHTKMTASERGDRVKELLAAWAWNAISRKCRAIFRAACKSEWDWRARWRWSRASCCSMSPPRGSIRSPRAKSMS